MDEAVVVQQYESVHAGTHVESITIVRTASAAYPSGWKYALHYGEIDGRTLLRYDNSHEATKGHERHTPTGTENIDFLGMEALYRRFIREIERLPPVDD